MYRIDHCENLIHFTKGKNKSLDYEDAYQNFKNILALKKLKAGSGMILDSRKLICFTESPARCLTNLGKLDTSYFSKYTPFGFMFNKKDVFNFGGRPVIYSLKSEYEIEKHNSNINWRYVSYDPTKDGKLDFTWEREWRIKKAEIEFDCQNVKLVFPNKNWIDRFVEEHEKEYHGMEIDNDCDECFCTREVTIINFTDFLTAENCETLIGTCPDPDNFPWVMINMNEDNCR